MRTLPDWNDFRDYIAEDMENIEELTRDGLIEAYQEYRVEELNIELSRKVDKNYGAFIQGIRDLGVDEAIKCCYEITVKTNIQSYIESEPADISEEQYNALISCKNPLDFFCGLPYNAYIETATASWKCKNFHGAFFYWLDQSLRIKI